MSLTYTTTITTSNFLDSKYNVHLIDASSSSINITLPSIVCNGMNYNLRRIDINSNNAVIIIPQNAALIDGNTTKILNTNVNIQLNSYNNNWHTNGTSGSGSQISIAFSQLVGNQIQTYVAINKPVFSALGVFLYNGSKYYGNIPIKLELTYSVNSTAQSDINFTVQLQDLTNAKIIATIGPVIASGSTTTYYTASTNTFINVSSAKSFIEIDGKIAPASNTVRLHSINMLVD